MYGKSYVLSRVESTLGFEHCTRKEMVYYSFPTFSKAGVLSWACSFKSSHRDPIYFVFSMCFLARCDLFCWSRAVNALALLEMLLYRSTAAIDQY